MALGQGTVDADCLDHIRIEGLVVAADQDNLQQLEEGLVVASTDIHMAARQMQVWAAAAQLTEAD